MNKMNENGLSLVEVMLAAAALGGLAIMGMQISQQSMKGVKTAETSLAKINFQQQILKYQNSINVCEYNLTGKKFSPDKDTEYHSPTPPAQSGNYLVPPFLPTPKIFLEISKEYQTGFSATTWKYLGYKIRNSKGNFPATPPAVDTIGFVDVIFDFQKKTKDIDYGSDVFSMVVTSEVVAAKSGQDYVIKKCSRTNQFNASVMCDILGGTYHDDGNGFDDLNDRCVNMAGWQRADWGNLKNTTLGKNSMPAITDAAENVGIGDSAMAALVDGVANVAIGTEALKKLKSGTVNIAIGKGTLGNIVNSNWNTSVGHGAITSMTSGDSNSALGSFALNQNTSGSENTAIGSKSLYNIKTGQRNIAIGSSAGLNATNDSSDNIFIGNNSGPKNSGTVKESLVIGSAHNPVIMGELGDAAWRTLYIGDIFDVGKVANGGAASTYKTIIKGDLEVSQSFEIKSASGMGYSLKAFGDIESGKTIKGSAVVSTDNMSVGKDFFVSGNSTFSKDVMIQGKVDIWKKLSVTDDAFVEKELTVQGGIKGNVTPFSDKNLKTKITELEQQESYEKILSLRPVNYYWNEQSRFPDKQLQYGLIAQDVAMIFPDLIKKGKINGVQYLTVDYFGIIAPLISSIQELDRKNKITESELEKIRVEIQELREILKNKLKAE